MESIHLSKSNVLNSGSVEKGAIDRETHTCCNDQCTQKINMVFQENSIPAIRKIGRSQTPVHRIFWIIVFLATFIGFLIHLGSIVLRFNEVPVTTEASVKKIDELPPVTICPQSYLNDIRFSKMNDLPHNLLRNITYDELYNDIIPVFWNLVYRTRNSTADRKGVGQKIKNNLLWYVSKFWTSAVEQEKQDIFLYFYQKNANLNLSHIQTTFDSNRNRCFALLPHHSANNVSGTLAMILHVPEGRYFYAEQDSFELVSDNGLWLNICFNNYYGCYDNIRFFLKTGRLTKVDLRKTLVSQISLRTEQTNCMEKSQSYILKEDIINISSKNIAVQYTAALCNDVHLQMQIYNMCNCLSLILPTEAVLFEEATRHGFGRDVFCSIPPEEVFLHMGFPKTCIKDTKEPISNKECKVQMLPINSSTEDTPIKTFKEMLEDEHVKKFLKRDHCHDYWFDMRLKGLFDCPKKCKRYQYSSVNSVVPWPESQLSRKYPSTFARIVVNTLNPYIDKALRDVTKLDLDVSVLHSLNDTFNTLVTENFDKKTSYNKGMEYLEERLVLLEVGYASDDMQVLKEQEAYPLKSFLSDVGGLIGLWIGMALVSICEVVLLIGKGIYFGVRKCYRVAGRTS